MANHRNDQNHTLVAHREYLTDNAAPNFTFFVEDFKSSGNIRGSTSVASSSSRPSTLRTSSSESGLSFASQTTVSTASKRSRGERHDYDGKQDDYDNTLRPQKRAKKASPTENEPAQLFACPYAKYDPSRYSAANVQELNYRSCSKSYLTDIARVKQHLYRVHERPQFHCSRCYEVFETQTILMDHVFSNSCALQESSSFDEKMTAEQCATIRKRTRGVDPYFTWYEIYRTLFPGAPLPPAPYATFASQNSESQDAFVQFVQERLPQRLSQRLTEMPTMNGVHQGSVAGSIEVCLVTIMHEIRLEFNQSLQVSGSPMSLKASPATREPSPILLPSDNMTGYLGEDAFYQDFSADTLMQQQGANGEQAFGSDVMVDDDAMDLYGLPTAIYNPQVASVEVSDVGDYFAGFHQAVTLPH